MCGVVQAGHPQRAACQIWRPDSLYLARFSRRHFALSEAAEPGNARTSKTILGIHDLIYEREGAIEASDLTAYAAEIGLDMAQFNECVTSVATRNE